MDLGRPPTKANFDSRTSPHRHVFEALLSQYLDDGNDDAAMFAYSDHVFWTLTGVRLDIAFSDFDTGLTANDIGAILEHINHHYQVAYRRNKQSGSHSDFENFVGTRYYLFYYHLWLNESPHLLNFAVAELLSDESEKLALVVMMEEQLIMMTMTIPAVRITIGVLLLLE